MNKEKRADKERSAPVLQPNLIGAYRALRVLQILKTTSDENHFVSTDQIVQELSHPKDPDALTLTSTRKTVYAAITVLRLAGYNISHRHKRGYALTERTIDDPWAESVVTIIARDPLTPTRKADEIIDRILPDATPSFREYELMRRQKRDADRFGPEEMQIELLSATDVIRQSIKRGYLVRFETEQTRNIKTDATNEKTNRSRGDEDANEHGYAHDRKLEQQSIAPTTMFIEDSKTYVTGKIFSAGGSPIGSLNKTIALERMQGIYARTDSGILLVAHPPHIP